MEKTFLSASLFNRTLRPFCFNPSKAGGPGFNP